MLRVSVDPEVAASSDEGVALRQGLVNLVWDVEDGEPRMAIQLRPSRNAQMPRHLAADDNNPEQGLAQCLGQLLKLFREMLGVGGTRRLLARLLRDGLPSLNLQVVERVADVALPLRQINLLSRTHVMNSGWKHKLLLAGLRTMSRANSTWYSPGSRSMYFMACCQFWIVVCRASMVVTA